MFVRETYYLKCGVRCYCFDLLHDDTYEFIKTEINSEICIFVVIRDVTLKRNNNIKLRVPNLKLKCLQINLIQLNRMVFHQQ